MDIKVLPMGPDWVCLGCGATYSPDYGPIHCVCGCRLIRLAWQATTSNTEVEK